MPADPTSDPAHLQLAPPGAPRVWAIGGGKGGVGKSFVSVNLAVAAAARGSRVILVDGDLGAANLDTLLGCARPKRRLGDFFARRVAALAEVVSPTPIANLGLVAGDAETLGAANPQHAQKLKLIRHLRALPADLIILDLGAGTAFNTLDLYLAADVGLTVTVPEPTALQNCFGFIKAATLRDAETRTGERLRDDGEPRSLRGELVSAGAREAVLRPARLIVNRARDAEGRRVTNMLHDLASRFLGSKVLLAGVVRDDPAVALSVRRGVPVMAADPSSDVARDLDAVLGALSRPTHKRSASPDMGMNEAVESPLGPVHLQTEDLGEDQGAVRSQVFLHDGRVVFTRRTPYQDAFFVRLGAQEHDRVRYHHGAIKKALQLGRIDLEFRRSA